MGSTPEHAEHAYRPTPAEELLARAKRRSAARRRRRLFTGGTSVAIVAAVVLLGILIPGGGKSQHSSQGPSRVHVTDRIGTAYELTVAGTSPRPAARRVAKAVQDAEVGFSIHLLSNLASSADSANVLVSPSSLATALAMLELGASGSTEQGIASTLDTPGLSAADQAAGWHALAALLGTETSTGAASLTQEPQLEIANALFLQQNFPVLPGFVRALSTGFQTGLWQVDFAHDLGGATDAINQWTSDHTMGLIKKLFSSGVLSPQTALVLADAVYFHADWAQSFESSTRDQPFYAAKGPAKDVPFMHSAPVKFERCPDSSGRGYLRLRRRRAALCGQEAERPRRDADRVLTRPVRVLAHPDGFGADRKRAVIRRRGRRPLDAFVHPALGLSAQPDALGDGDVGCIQLPG